MANSFDDKIRLLIRALQMATESNQLNWESTDRPFAYLTSLHGRAILMATKDDDGRDPFVLELINNDGGRIESFSSEDGRDLLNLLAGLYDAVRRQSTGITKVIDEMLDQLPKPPDLTF